MRADGIWITWEDQVRNRSMAKWLGVELHVIRYPYNRPARYFMCLIRSTMLLIKKRPKVVFAPNPSVVLALLLLHLKGIFRFRYVMDAHLGGVIAFNGNKLLQDILDYCLRRADMVIVTNENHRKHVDALGGSGFVCEDPLPDLPDRVETRQLPERSIFFICSFDIDEPYKEVFDAARNLVDEGYVVYVSGNYDRAKIDVKEYPHVRFLGFISYAEFLSFLVSTTLVLDLTSCENCLVCGAYEAMAAGKPLVTSDTEALRSYFTLGTVFTSHDPEAIAEAVRRAYETRRHLAEEIIRWKGEILPRHLEKMRDLKKMNGLRA